MKVDVETLSDSLKQIRVEISQETVQKEFEKVYRDLTQNAVIPGFRKGKIPRSMLKLRMGSDIAMQIGYDLVKETLPDAMKKIQEKVVGMPDIGEWNIQEDKPFVYEAKIEILPPIELKDYKNMEVPKRKLDIPEEDVNAGLERIREGQATFEVVEDRPAQNDDRIIGRISLKVGDESLPGWTNRTLDIDLGQDTFFPGSGMEDKMVGAETGKEHPFAVDIPEDYSWYKDIAGKTVSAVLTLNDIKTKVLPDINDDLAVDMGLETVDDLRKMVRSDLEDKLNQSIEEEFEQAIFNKIYDFNTVPAPEMLVETEAERFVDNYFSQQTSLPEDHKQQLVDSMKPMAEQNVKKRLVLDRIAELEDIQATEDDLNKAFEEMAEQAKKDVETIRVEWEEEDAVGNLKRELARRKAMEWLKENVVIVDLPLEETEPDDDTVSADESNESTDDHSE
jgi:trigger factor